MTKMKTKKDVVKSMTCDELCFTEKNKRSEVVEDEMHDKECCCCGDNDDEN